MDHEVHIHYHEFQTSCQPLGSISTVSISSFRLMEEEGMANCIGRMRMSFFLWYYDPHRLVFELKPAPESLKSKSV